MRIAILVLILSTLLVASAEADGCPPSTCGAQGLAVPGSPTLAIRPSGPLGALQSYDVAAARQRFALPAGALSADGRRFVTVRPRRSETTLGLFDARTGRRLHVWSIAGRWQAARVSAHGRRVALAPLRNPQGTSRLAIVDTASGDLLRTVRLHGFYEVDAVTDTGRRLYLVQHLDDGSLRYRVRAYDLRLGRLEPKPVRDPAEPGAMAGTAWNAVASPDGRWLLTLYLKGNGDGAFVHVLDIARRTAVCIDLPSGGYNQTMQYGLVLSPDGRRLYAANPALGRVATIDLAARKIVSTARLAARSTAADAFGSTGAVSRDGRTIYYTAGSPLWAFDSAYGRIRGPYDVGGLVAGVGFSPDDRHLLVVREDGTTAMLDAATGAPLP